MSLGKVKQTLEIEHKPALKVSFKVRKIASKTKHSVLFHLHAWHDIYTKKIKLPSAPIIVALTVATIFNWVLIVGILSIVWVSVWKISQQHKQRGFIWRTTINWCMLLILSTAVLRIWKCTLLFLIQFFALKRSCSVFC